MFLYTRYICISTPYQDCQGISLLYNRRVVLARRREWPLRGGALKRLHRVVEGKYIGPLAELCQKYIVPTKGRGRRVCVCACENLAKL